MRTLFSTAVATALSAVLLATPAAADWQPEQPVTVIVPWGAGGSTDQVVRVLAAELEDAFGQTFVIVNQPGAGGSIGTRSVLEADADGYTWASGAAKDLGVYPVSGLLDTRIDDWHLFLGVINSSVVGVNASTPYQTFDELLEAMRANPNGVTVATAGINSSGGAALGAVSTAADVEARHVTYDGGNPAVTATAGGETEVTTQLAVEQAEMIRAGRIRPLAVVGGQPLTLEGYGDIPPITDFLPDFPVADNYFGVFLPKGTPDEIVAAVTRVWEERIANSEALRNYAESRGAIMAVLHGDAARDAVMPAVQDMAWGLWERNEAQANPEDVGIPPL